MDLVFVVGEPGSCFVVDDSEGTGVLVEIVDDEEMARPLSRPDGEQARVAGERADVIRSRSLRRGGRLRPLSSSPARVADASVREKPERRSSS